MTAFSPYSERITNLKPGDEIIIERGYGYPYVRKKKRDIVAAIDGLSVITVSGIRLFCLKDGEGVKPTGRHFKTFNLNSEAKAILERIS